MSDSFARENLTQEMLWAALDYDPETGEFTWKWREDMPNNWNRHYAGKAAGSTRKVRNVYYRRVGINDTLYLAHRLAVLYMTGAFPEHEIDHIDGNGLNNRFANLRAVAPQTNRKNMALSARSTTGVSGVSWHKLTSKYVVQVKHDGKKIHGGSFATLEAAAARATEMYADLGFHPNHGLTREQRATTTARPTVSPHQPLLENPFEIPSDERYCDNPFGCI